MKGQFCKKQNWNPYAGREPRAKTVRVDRGMRDGIYFDFAHSARHRYPCLAGGKSRQLQDSTIFSVYAVTMSKIGSSISGDLEQFNFEKVHLLGSRVADARLRARFIGHPALPVAHSFIDNFKVKLL